MDTDGNTDWLVGSRLRRQQLRPPGAAGIEEALKNLLAVQSQEFAYARWSLAQRCATGAADDDGGLAARVEDAVADGTVLRTHVLRPTWHFVHRDDLDWLMELSAPRLHQGNKGMYRQTGVDAKAAARSADILAAAVAGGAHKTREDLATVLGNAGFPSKGLGFIYLLMHAEINRVLVSGAPVRSAGGALKQTYAAFPERARQDVSAGHGATGAARREASLGQLALRYFRSRGPATVKDCAAWSGLTMGDVREGLRLAADISPGSLASFSRDGMEFHLAAEELDAVASAASGARSGAGAAGSRGVAPTIDLIQCYDEYVMGYSQTRNHLGGTAPYFAAAGAPMHVVLLDGRLAGWWRHDFSGGECLLDARMDHPLDAAGQSALEAEAARYGAFLEMPARLV
ncbi:winged helix DNA-binding domain-containing protein [Arthrobacter celericrescens]|uniref:winged helix DNA-binding domain-containing protein n=1 Tax=Arthrobacter celericrescens TaxID=2320851 RepID=UPI001FE14719|nr:winged helix DNA-binding domain-containing protein [Arthrobacter celericrescens]